MKRLACIIGGIALCGAAAWSSGALAASHREAPLIAQDPTADNTDFYMFRSWTNPDNVVFILNAIPLQDPGGGPNYYNFGDDVLYRINVDTNADGEEDLSYEIRFKTQLRGPLTSLDRWCGLRGADPPAELYGDPGARRHAHRSRHAADVRRALERRSVDDAAL
jgi:hypothetical protein